MKTVTVKASDIKREWHTIDASEEILGKLATRAANLLMGKHNLFLPGMPMLAILSS